MLDADFELDPPAGLSVEQACSDTGRLLVSFPLRGTPAKVALTQSEGVIVSALCRGLTRREIADSRGVSERTVSNQIASVFQKLGVHSKLDLMLRLGCAAPSPTTGRGSEVR